MTGGNGDARRQGATKSSAAFRTIGEVAEELNVAQHVLRFWETRFPRLRPLKRGGGRRYYRPEDIRLLRRIKQLLYSDGYTIKGVQRLIRQDGPGALQASAERRPADRDLPGAGPGETGPAAPTPPGAGDRKTLERAIAALESCRRLLAGGA